MTPLVVENEPPVTFLRRKMTGGRFSMGVVIRRYTGRIHAFWSTDGRLFMKVTESGFKHRVDSIDDLNNLVPPSDEPWQSDGHW